MFPMREMKLRQLHEDLRIMVVDDEVTSMDCSSSQFLSMCVTIHQDLHRDALFFMVEKFPVVGYIAKHALQHFKKQYTAGLGGAKIERKVDGDPKWKQACLLKIDHLKAIKFGDSLTDKDVILRSIHDMIQHRLHIDAMFETCDNYGFAARKLVDYVLQMCEDSVYNADITWDKTPMRKFLWDEKSCRIYHDEGQEQS